MRSALAVALLALLALVPASTALAVWPAAALRICEGGPDGGRIWPEIDVKVDPNGIVFMVGRGHVFGSMFRLTPDGDPVAGWWPSAVVVGSPVLDGAGGAHDVFGAPFSEPRGVYLTRYDATGALAPGWTASGTDIGTDAVSRAALIATPDGAGGAFVVWQDGRSGSATTTDLYLQRVDGEGAPSPGFPGGVWVATLAQSANVTRHQWTLDPDGQGGVFVSWLVAGTLHLQRLDGALDAHWPGEGFAIATGGGMREYQQVVADGVGGAYLTWTGGAGCRVLHVGADGTPFSGWPTDGVTLTGSTGTTSSASDGVGGAIVAWRTATGTRALRFGPDGADAGWPTAGAVLRTDAAAAVLGGLACTMDGLGGAIVAMSDEAGLFAQRVSADGVIAPHWPENGALVRASGHPAAMLRLAPLGPGDAVAMWVERWPAGSTTHSDDSYAQRIGFAVPLAVEPLSAASGLALALAGSSPSRARIALVCTLADADAATVRVLDASGRVCALATLSGAGQQRLTLPSTGALAPGIYLVELRQRDARRMLKAVVLR